MTIWSLDGSEFPSTNSNPFLHLGTILDEKMKAKSVRINIPDHIMSKSVHFLFLGKDNFSTMILLEFYF